MFNVNGYVNQMSIEEGELEVLERTRDANQALQILCDDAYLARALFWGVASAMENQLSYLGGNFLPNLERSLNRLSPNGILSEDSLDLNKFSNESHAHINDDESIDDQKAEIEARIDQVRAKMDTAAIMYVEAVRNHDEISHLLGQMTYSGIKAAAAAKRQTARVA